MNNDDTPIYIPWWWVIGGAIGVSVFLLGSLLSLIWFFLAPDVDPNVKEEELSLLDYYNETAHFLRSHKFRSGNHRDFSRKG